MTPAAHRAARERRLGHLEADDLVLGAGEGLPPLGVGLHHRILDLGLGDAAKAEEAASRLRLTSDDLLGFGIVDEYANVIQLVHPDVIPGANNDQGVYVPENITEASALLRSS